MTAILKFKLVFTVVLAFVGAGMNLTHAQNKVVVIPMFEDGAAAKWHGAWASGQDYRKGDIVEDGGSSYIAIAGHTSDLSNIPPDNDFWGLVAASGANGIQGPQGDQGPAGANGMDGVDGADGDQGMIGDVGPAGPKGDDAPLPPNCIGSGKVLQFDGAIYSCVSLTETQLSNGMANGFELLDAWGDAWDGLSRPVKNWDQANAICQAAGGRLPSVTELFRVNNATGSGSIASAGQTSYHWSLIPRDDQDRYYQLRFTDGGNTYSDGASVAPYRCIWPIDSGSAFSGKRCYGPPGDACFSVSAEGGHYNVDKFDRPSITPSAATRECALFGAHLPTQNALTESIQAGLPNGTNSYILTSDHEGWNGTNFLVGVVRWTDTQLTFSDAYPGESTWTYNRTSTQTGFRCAGLKTMFLPFGGAVNDAFSDSNLLSTSSTVDSASTSSYLDAIDACRANGGHLPYQRDLNELIIAGLPNGSDSWLWTADTQMGDASPAQTGVIKWTGTNTKFTDYYSTYATWANRNTASNYYRCVYYPNDSSYTGPPDGDCASGSACFSKTVNNSSVDSTMWMDIEDRIADTYGNAARACFAVEGHLPTHRDYAEMIRAGLPAGTNNFVWTSDHVRYDLTRLVRWNATDLGWSDTEGVDASAGTRSSGTRPYRCAWSNELSW